ncbi:MAG: magnesium transporter [Caldilineaceae bacterium]
MVDPIDIGGTREHVLQLIESNNYDEAVKLLRSLHAVDSAEILTTLDQDQQAAMVERLHAPELAEVFEQMSEGDMAEVAQHLDTEELAEVLDEMEADSAADLLGELEPQEAAEVLEQMDEAAPVASLLSYPDDSAGGIMNLPPPSLRRYMTVAGAIKFLKQHYHDASEIFYLYVLDRDGRLIGVVNLRALVLAESTQTIEEIMSRDVIWVRVDMDQEEAAQILSRYSLMAVPVVNEEEKLVGIITVDDVVDVIEEEATEDIYRLAQVSERSEIFSPIRQAVPSRLFWLAVNLGTAFLASGVAAMFSQTIALVPILAAFMTIVAGQGGNAATQTMTIVIRSLALGEISIGEAWPVLWYEFLVGLLDGLAIGAMVGITAWLWQGKWMLGVIISIAMLGNMLVAALAGVLIPMVLKWMRVDPALASGVIVTTFTDCCGFGFFLGLATYLIHWLM